MNRLSLLYGWYFVVLSCLSNLGCNIIFDCFESDLFFYLTTTPGLEACESLLRWHWIKNHSHGSTYLNSSSLKIWQVWRTEEVYHEINDWEAVNTGDLPVSDVPVRDVPQGDIYINMYHVPCNHVTRIISLYTNNEYIFRVIVR